MLRLLGILEDGIERLGAEPPAQAMKLLPLLPFGFAAIHPSFFERSAKKGTGSAGRRACPLFRRTLLCCRAIPVIIGGSGTAVKDLTC